jgi:hypothetical protein
MSKDCTAKSGYRGTCKDCMAKKAAQYRKDNPEKFKATLSKCARKRLYGMSQEEYERRCKEQNNRCKICGKPSTHRHLDVDHDHETRQLRDLLCNRCNGGLGLFGDNIKLLLKAVAYLKKWETQWKLRNIPYVSRAL